MLRFRIVGVAFCAIAAAAVAANSASAQIGYGVNAAGNLFRFDVNSPAAVTTIGPVGFIPAGIDFRPGTNTLYALDVTPTISRLYTIDTGTGASTPVGAFFISTGSVGGVSYNLVGNQSFGFDFDPKSLQGDGSMQIRLISTNGVNLRLNSTSGQIDDVDTNLLIQPGSNAPFSNGAAYINNVPAASGVTQLFDMDVRNNALYLQAPPNSGTMTKVGDFGVTINNVQGNIGFDVFTTPGDVDPSTTGDFAYAVLKRPDAPVGGPLGAYLLYHVNLATGVISGGALVGPAATPFDFDGDFAVAPLAVPEPACLVLGAVGCALVATLRPQKSRPRFL